MSSTPFPSSPDESVLDNPVWNALNGPLAHLAVREGRAARLDPAMSPFVGLADGEPDSWEDLARLLGPGRTGILAGGPQRPPETWTETFRLVGLQMIGDAVRPPADPDPELVELGDADADAMFQLAARTRPGPFERRTHTFGGYLGVYRDGRLVAMAGERIRPPGWSEISAVCTDEDVRGQGLAGRLVTAVAGNILRRGETPMLHVAGDNLGAIRLYERLGFRRRGPITFAAVVTPGS